MTYSLTITQTPVERELCYDIRKAVFVEEQAVPLELEMDEYDDIALHFLLRGPDQTPLATARLLDKHGLAKIGRVAVVKEARGQRLGLMLMRFVLEEAQKRRFHRSCLRLADLRHSIL